MKLKERLAGSQVVIRGYTADDMAFCSSMWQDEENGKYMSDPMAQFVDDEYQEALEAMKDCEDGFYMIIELTETGERVGSCCAFPDETGTIYDIGYCIEKTHWRKGLASEAIDLLIDWIRMLGGQEITAEVAVDNAASNALLRKFGFAVKERTSFKKYHMDIAFDSYIYNKRLNG